MKISEERLSFLADQFESYKVSEYFGLTFEQFVDLDQNDHMLTAKIHKMYALQTYYAYFAVSQNYFLTFDEFSEKVEAGTWDAYQKDVKVYHEIRKLRLTKQFDLPDSESLVIDSVHPSGLRQAY